MKKNTDHTPTSRTGKRTRLIVAALAVIAVLGAGWWMWRSGAIDTASRSAGRDSTTGTTGNAGTSQIPAFLQNAFPDTDWSRSDPELANAVDGGPGKDGIPALEGPDFEPIGAFPRSDDTRAIVLEHGGKVKVYPYNILIWHEIVNDTIAGKDVVVTFCPLCGSAIVYDRDVAGEEVTTFGVSGALLESNLIMYDRASQSLWQQSTGEALAGTHMGEQLERVKFQLLSVGEARTQHPKARILSEDTGHPRDYGRNPYSGYEDNEEYIFRPSSEDHRFPSKKIFVAFNVHDTPVAIPRSQVTDVEKASVDIDGKPVTIRHDEGEITIRNADGETVPFYFEMWFSWAVQHEEDGEVVEL